MSETKMKPAELLAALEAWVESSDWNFKCDGISGSRLMSGGRDILVHDDYFIPMVRQLALYQAVAEAARKLLDESMHFTRERCSAYGESYGLGTDGEQAMRAALAKLPGGEQ